VLPVEGDVQGAVGRAVGPRQLEGALDVLVVREADERNLGHAQIQAGVAAIAVLLYKKKTFF
jgi:hypothetical protein